MEIRLSSVLLAAALLSGCGWFHRGEKSARSRFVAEEPQAEPSIIEPQVNRREVKTPKIKAKDFELGGYFGALSIQDFGTNSIYGVRAAYHVSEDIFLEGFVARSKAGLSSIEDVFPDITVISDSGRHFTYYDLDVGYNVLPGEIFFRAGTRVQFRPVCHGRAGRCEIRRQGPIRAQFRRGRAAVDHGLARDAPGCERPRVRNGPDRPHQECPQRRGHSRLNGFLLIRRTDQCKFPRQLSSNAARWPPSSPQRPPLPRRRCRRSGACFYVDRARRTAVRPQPVQGPGRHGEFSGPTWCGPCQQEMPLLDQMYKKYKPAGFTLIGVNVDKEEPAVKELLARKPVSFPVLLDPAKPGQQGLPRRRDAQLRHHRSQG